MDTNYLLMGALGLLVFLLVKRILFPVKPAEKPKVDLASCRYCGQSLPREMAVTENALTFCSIGHQAMYHKAQGKNG